MAYELNTNHPNLTFKIANISAERRINGSTLIRAVSIDGVFVDIILPNSEASDRVLIKDKLTEEYKRLKKSEDVSKERIIIGTIL